MNICVVGLGYVGLTTAAVLAGWGHHTACFDCDSGKTEKLKRGIPAFFEPGLPDLLDETMKDGRLAIADSLSDAIDHARVIFLAVQTPMGSNGHADLSHLLGAAAEVSGGLRSPAVIVTKSTSPPGTSRRLDEVFSSCRFRCPVVVNPEFLREGSALMDARHPDRIVVGSSDPDALEAVAALYTHLQVPIVKTDPESAELIKYASNAFLATRISMVNALSRLCGRIGANIEDVAAGIGLDSRIGPQFLEAGPGYGGSCFPKDVSGLIQWSDGLGYDFALLRAVQTVNEEQMAYVHQALEELLGRRLRKKRIALLGLAFKAGTDDIRESPALKLASVLEHEGCLVSGYDPRAMENVSRAMPSLELHPDAISACRGAEAVLIMTEWPEFAGMELDRLGDVVGQKVLIDARNLFAPGTVREAGWKYWSVGRP